MFPITHKKELAPMIKGIDVKAPYIARKARAGQFVIVRINDKGERIPLTIAGRDVDKGMITLIFQEVGKTTCQLGKLKSGDAILDLAGPLGKATELKKYGTVACIGGGVGVAEVYPVARALKEKGNRIIGIIGARSKNLLILEQEMRALCDAFYVTTDDGSYGEQGFTSSCLENLIKQKKPIDLVYAIGPLPMMRAVSEVTRPSKIKTIVSLNPVMVDGTGMCGSCRVSIGGATKFACVDGPEFDGHLVDFDELGAREGLFSEAEKKAMRCCKKGRKN